MNITRFCFVGIAMLALCKVCTYGAVFVDSNASGAGNGTSWYDAFTSLSDALEQSDPGSEIWVASGVYTPGDSRTDSFVLKDGMIVLGGFLPGASSVSERNPETAPTIFSGEIQGDGELENNSFHVVTGAPGAELNGVIVVNGCANGNYPNDNGGGLWLCDIKTSAMTVTDVTFTNNSAINGGAVYVTNSGFTAKQCIFDGNKADKKGGAAFLVKVHDLRPNSPDVTICDSTFRGNSARKFSRRRRWRCVLSRYTEAIHYFIVFFRQHCQ